jgi:hypothetical protein
MIAIVIQDQEVLSYLSKIQATLKDLTPAMAGIGMELEAAVSGRFETKTDPEGNPGPPGRLAPRSLTRTTAMGPSLTATGTCSTA